MFSPAQVHLGGSAATEGNQFSVVSGQFSVMSPAQVHPRGSVATEGSGGGVQPSTAPPDASSFAGSFIQHGFMTKSILEGAQRPKDLAAGSRNNPPPHRMLRHSQAHSSSMDL
ncbi:MAG: hypothetical protein FWF18_02380 [Dehalococcoidia bacterium]|nr:hypothetical protein [Dehalococcoidia bacterium]